LEALKWQRANKKIHLTKRKKFMKKACILFICLLTLCSRLSAQDLLTLKNGEDIQVKVTEINKTSVMYRRFDNIDGPIYSVDKSDVLIIRYSNGTKDIFNINEKHDVVDKPKLNKEIDYCSLGENDAFYNYRGYKGAGTGTFLTTLLLSPIAGLVPAISCSSTPPKEYNLNYPNAELAKNFEYQRGYRWKAAQMKSNIVWKNWGIAFGINVVLVLVLVSGN